MPDEIDTSNMSAEEIAELQKQNCIFCKIATKQIPSKVLHEDDKAICILDINPASEGHILIMPKEHYMILPHIPDDLLAHMFDTVKLMSNTLLKTLQCQGTSIFIANGMAAGQKAPHVLIHVFPRKENDGLLELPKYEMNAEQADKLKKTLKPYFEQVFNKHTDIKHKKKIHHIEEHEETAKKDIADSKKEHKKEKDYDNQKEHDKEKKPIKHDAKQDDKPKKDSKNVNLDDIAKLFGG
ncbi:TPA: HIT domain-containing protein [Candidatus Woesearchaeota archaeon]|nr:hypothetical protein [uncultured archaeon]MBS3173299.1 HIT domain-containing protein [Candidatus Woesearchaeota archaeon]HIH31805.1 HIT domain-containing protein [Candidatus Woesearchaeota archaeon]HIH55480.1 HIT domain-containing protein [Candidatus Woesearchaeota archaeon]HIJ01878.1 HIT domain-containing protein [Candidatus Woesearchaeota archaeon]